jgi:hypothetical protein
MAARPIWLPVISTTFDLIREDSDLDRPTSLSPLQSEQASRAARLVVPAQRCIDSLAAPPQGPTTVDGPEYEAAAPTRAAALGLACRAGSSRRAPSAAAGGLLMRPSQWHWCQGLRLAPFR